MPGVDAPQGKTALGANNNMSARIAILLPRFSRYGGAEAFGYRLAEQLATQGHSIDFICARQETPAPAGVCIKTVGRFGGVRAAKMLWFALQAERLRKKGRYDLCFGLGKSLRQDVLRIGGGPLRAFWQLSEQAWPAGAARYVKRLRRRSSPANRLSQEIEKRQAASAGHVVAVSHAVAGWFMQQHPHISPDVVSVIYNEPDPDRFFPAPKEMRTAARQSLRRLCGIPDKVRCIGFAGSNFRLKGLTPLLKALQRLPNDVHLVVAGGRSPAPWLHMANELHIANRVHFAGKIEDMPSFYNGLDAFALPSFYDACANAILEAVACGVPSVSSAANGSSLVLPPGHVVLDPAEVPPLVDALELALEGAPARLAWPAGTLRGLNPWLELTRDMLHQAGSAGA